MRPHRPLNWTQCPTGRISEGARLRRVAVRCPEDLELVYECISKCAFNHITAGSWRPRGARHRPLTPATVRRSFFIAGARVAPGADRSRASHGSDSFQFTETLVEIGKQVLQVRDSAATAGHAELDLVVVAEHGDVESRTVGRYRDGVEVFH